MKILLDISATDPRYTGTRQDVRTLISKSDVTDIRIMQAERKTIVEET
jgi:hypothetical protein